MSKNMIKWTLGLLAVGCLLAIAAPAGAEVIQQKDSANFDWKYEMEVDDGSGGMTDVKPSETDLEPNGTMDFTEYGNGGSSSVLDGVLTIAGGGSSYRYFKSSADLELWPLQAYNYKDGYTFEIRMRIDPSVSEGSKGLLMFNAHTGNADANRALGYIKKTGMGWYNGAYIALETTDDNADGEWHTFRFAQEPNSGAVGEELFSVWRDGVLVAGSIPGGPTSSTVSNIEFGDMGGSQQGTFEVDYFRFTDGAYAPIPEPSTLMLLAGGLLSLLVWWRR